MAFDFLTSGDATTGILLIVIFILFILSFKKVLGLIKTALIIVAGSVLFPLFANKLLGMDIPFDGDTVISFMIVGIGLYGVYLFASALFKALSTTQRAVGGHIPHRTAKKQKKKDADNDRKSYTPAPSVRRPAPVSSRKAKDWEKDYIEIGEPSKKERPAPPQKKPDEREEKRRSRSQDMERIRVIGDDDEEND